MTSERGSLWTCPQCGAEFVTRNLWQMGMQERLQNKQIDDA